MKLVFAIVLFTSFSVKASPIFTMKERLRLHLWSFGLEDRPQKEKLPVKARPVLPEELEHVLRKM